MASFSAFARLEMGRCIMGSRQGRQARTVKCRYLREASHEPRQQAMELQLPDMGHVWMMCLDYRCFAQHTLPALEGRQFTPLTTTKKYCSYSILKECFPSSLKMSTVLKGIQKNMYSLHSQDSFYLTNNMEICRECFLEREDTVINLVVLTHLFPETGQ